MKNVQKFARSQTFHKIIISLIVGLVVDKKETDSLKQLFKEMDTNEDGSLDKAELEEALE